MEKVLWRKGNTLDQFIKYLTNPANTANREAIMKVLKRRFDDNGSDLPRNLR